jgi:hypothetical protein
MRRIGLLELLQQPSGGIGGQRLAAPASKPEPDQRLCCA